MQWYVNAFPDVVTAVFFARQMRNAACDGAISCTTQVAVNVAPGTYTNGSFGVDIGSGIRLLGSGAEQTALVGASGNTVVNISGDDVEVSGFTLRGGTNAGAAGINVVRGKNVHIRRNILRGNTTGVLLNNGASGEVVFNTLVNNVYGITADGSSTNVIANSNILANNTTRGTRALNGAAFGVRNSLFNANGVNLEGGEDLGGNLVNSNPLFTNAAGDDYSLQQNSPAIDAADNRQSTIPGGGAVADMGYREYLAPPVVLMLGAVGASCTMATSGVASVDYGNVPVPNPANPLTATLPTPWLPVTVASPGAVATNWNTAFVVAGDGLRRLYSRATDTLGNQETPQVSVLDRFGDTLPAPRCTPSRPTRWMRRAIWATAPHAASPACSVLTPTPSRMSR